MPTLQFKGRVFVENHHLGVPFHELLPVRSKGISEKASLHDNLIVEGDNLASLKALLPTYHGKVKCIYIDPPYNTGNEGWAYNDNVNSPMMQDWLGKVVDRDDLTRHDKWCCMMLPRLKLLRELLRDDGAIFVSIDDNEGPSPAGLDGRSFRRRELRRQHCVAEAIRFKCNGWPHFGHARPHSVLRKIQRVLCHSQDSEDQEATSRL